MYLVAHGGVTALEASSGEQIWHQPNSASASVRGMSYWQAEEESSADSRALPESRILVVRDEYLLALSARTGESISSFGTGGRIDLRRGLDRDPHTIKRIATMTPGRIYKNLIIMGSAVGDDTYAGAPGDIRAYDVLSGELIWRFHTIPRPGEHGYDTWPEGAWQTAGAANAWTAMTVDEQRGIVYAPTGAPSYHFYGGNREGDNLFANTLLALDASTGKRLWHFQATHHDIWDYDLAMSPKLLTVQKDEQKRAAIALATKQGLMFVFDRVTGEPIYPIEERPVPRSDVPGEKASPTQPYAVGLPPFARQTLQAEELSPFADEEAAAVLAQRIRHARNEGLYTPPSFDGSVSAPGSRGGAQHGNGAVITEEGVFYLAVIESPTIPKLELKPVTATDDFVSASAKASYDRLCAACHGVGGEGQMPLFPRLVGVGQRLSLAEFRDLLHQGRGRMEAFPQLQEVTIARLWAFMDSLDGLSADAVAPLPSDRMGADIQTATHRFRSGYHHFFAESGLLGPPPALPDR